MFALARFQLPKTPLGAAMRQILTRAGVKPEGIVEDNESSGDFAVFPRPGSSPFTGIAPLFSVAATSGNTELFPNSGTAASRAAVQQWVSAAEQLSKDQLELAELEARFVLFTTSGATAAAASSDNAAAAAAKGGSKAAKQPSLPSTFLAGTKTPSAADLLVLAAVKTATSGAAFSPQQAKVEAPTLAKWVDRIVKDNEACREFGQGAFSAGASATAAGKKEGKKPQDGAAAAAAAAAAVAGGEDKKAGAAFEKGVAPSAAEIAARKAEKERLKAEKAEKAAAAAASGAADKKEAGGSSKAGAAAAAQAEERTTISKMHFVVGRVLEVAPHPDSDKLYIEQIDVGADLGGPRTIVSGLQQHIKVEEFRGKNVLVIANLEPRKLAGIVSAGMVLCAQTDDKSKIMLVEVPIDAKPGERFMFPGHPGPAEPVLKKNKAKLWSDEVAPGLKTDAEGVATLHGMPFVTSAGPCGCRQLPNSLIA